MATHITSPTIIEPAGTTPNVFEEYVGLVNSTMTPVSIARMNSPTGWTEPAQIPEFDEYTVILHDVLHVKTQDQEMKVKASEAMITRRGKRVQYTVERQ